MDTLKKVNDILDNFTGQHNEIDYDTSISLDLGISSLDFFEIICEIEQAFDIKVEDSKIYQFQKIGDLISYIEDGLVIEKKDERATAIELAKALCMIGLPLIHIIEQFVISANAVDTKVFNFESLLVLTVLGPGVFLICMGYDIKHETKPGKLLSDGICLILIGFILNIVRFFIPYFIMLSAASKLSALNLTLTLIQSDIYYVAGLFYILLAGLRKLKCSDFTVLTVSILLLSLNTVITGSEIFTENSLLSFTLGNIIYMDETSIFPVFGWAVFPAFGIILAQNPIEKRNKSKLIENIFFLLALFAALMASLWYFKMDILSIAVNQANSYVIEMFNAVIQLGLACIFLYALQLTVLLTRKNAIESFLKSISYYLIPFYFIHWVIVGWVTIPVVALYHNTGAMPVWELVLLIVLITLASLWLSVKKGMKLMRGLIKITSFKFLEKKDARVSFSQKTLHELVSKNGKFNSTVYEEYIGDEVKKLSRKMLKRKAFSIADYFSREGFKNEKVGILCDKSINWAIVFYGITCGRNTAVLINPDLPEENIIDELCISDCTALLYPAEMEEKAESILARLPSLRMAFSFEKLIDKADKKQKGKHTFDIPSENDIAAMLFSSGTTKLPKCVKLTHKNIISDVLSLQAIGEANGFGKIHNTLTVLPVSHAFSLTISVIYTLSNGGKTAFSKSILHIVDDIKRAKPDHLTLVPKMAKMLAVMALNEKEGSTIFEKLGGTVKHIFCGGAIMPDELYDIYRNQGIQLCNGYGITECSPIVSVNVNDCYVEGSLGFPLPGVDIKISEDGEILVKGDIVSPGYYNNPEADMDAFEDGWFKTGDLGEIDSNGAIWFKGRTTNLIVLSNGENISAEMVESAIGVCPHILGLKVYEKNDHLAVEIYPDKTVPDVEKIISNAIQEVNENLPDIWKIRGISFREEDFERTSVGKIIR